MNGTRRGSDLTIRSFRGADADGVVALWDDCGLVRPWNDPNRDIARKLTTQPELFLIGEVDGLLVATAMAGYDGHRGWVNYLAVAPGAQGLAYGHAMMDEAERLLEERGCPKVNVQIRRGNEAVIDFYSRLGYVSDETVSMGKRLIADD